MQTLLKHPALWRGHQQEQSRDTLATGHTELNRALPGGGWPIGALTELMVATEGAGEFTLLLPALAALTQQQQWIALVAPPRIPYAPALKNADIDLAHTLIVEAGDVGAQQKQRFWAAEQLLRSGVFSAVVLWTERNGDERAQRRLQLAAEHGSAFCACYRPAQAARNASPAALRIVLDNHDDQLHIDIIKNRGGRLREMQLANPARPFDLARLHNNQLPCDNKSQQRVVRLPSAKAR